MNPSPTDDDPHRIPGRTTPTWEMELLISGATVFGLLQLPAQIDAWMIPRIAASPEVIASLLKAEWMYARFSVLALVVGFILHLCLRGYWVALVGMHSLYPGGIRWQRTRFGPHARAIAEALDPGMGERIEAADNRATRVFGLGFGLAMVMLVPLLLVGLALAAAVAAVAYGVPSDLIAGGLWLALLLVMAPLVLAMLSDRRMGARVAANSLVGRWLRRVIGFYARLGIGGTRNPLILLYSSNEARLNGRWPMVAAVFALMLLAVLQLAASVDGLPLARFAGLADESFGQPRLLLAAHYASLRSSGPTLRPVPVIPDPVVQGDYLRLFLPYRPRVHDAALAHACPQALTTPGIASLDCLARIEPVALDGRRVTLAFDSADDAVTGQRGMLAMIPVRDLVPGRHELAIWLPRPGASASRDPDYRIPFWK